MALTWANCEFRIRVCPLFTEYTPPNSAELGQAVISQQVILWKHVIIQMKTINKMIILFMKTFIFVSSIKGTGYLHQLQLLLFSLQTVVTLTTVWEAS